LNGSTGEVRYSDSAGNSGSLGFYNLTNPISLSLFAGSVFGNGTNCSINLNYGYSAPVITPPVDFFTYCTLPEPVLCEPVTWIINQGIPPATQLLTQGGANNLTITAECTQSANYVGASGLAANQVVPAGITEEVKIETQVTNIPPAPTAHQPFVSLGFFHDIETLPIPVSFINYVPYFALMSDILGGFVGGIGQFPFASPTNMALYFNPNVQKKVYVFSVSSGGDGTVDVHGVVTNVSSLYQQEDIAQFIVENGFTNPNIESIVQGGNFGSTDSRDVIITYTEAAGDFPVDVTATPLTVAPPEIFEQPSNSKPFALFTSRMKFSNIGTSRIYDIPAINYNPSKPLYMVSSINAGDVIGGQMISIYNFGSKEFLLGEDANRWCEAT
jgi:hypothetical protein